MLSFFPRGVLDEILNLIESVSEGFPSYSCGVLIFPFKHKDGSFDSESILSIGEVRSAPPKAIQKP